MTKRNTGINAILTGADKDLPPVARDRRPAEGDDERKRYADEVEPPSPRDLGCVVKQLPTRLIFKAAEVAARINPVNAPVVGLSTAVEEGVLPTALAAAV